MNREEDFGGVGDRASRWMPELKNLLHDVRACGVDLDANLVPLLAAYVQAVAASAGPANLVSRGDLSALVAKHVGACLGILRLEPGLSEERWVDIGTGAGLPGLVIKICRPQLRMTLVDQAPRKIEFLRGVRADLGLQKLELVCGRAQDLAGMRTAEAPASEPGGEVSDPPVFDVLLMRAVTSLARSLRLVRGLARPGSRFLTFKGPRWREELDAAQGRLRDLEWELEGVHSIPWAKPRIIRLRKQ